MAAKRYSEWASLGVSTPTPTDTSLEDLLQEYKDISARLAETNAKLEEVVGSKSG